MIRLLALLVLLPSVALADTLLKNEGADAGLFQAINCVGGNINCTRSGSVATITIIGSTEATAPLVAYNDGGSVGLSCTSASQTSAGCVTTGPQTFAGIKLFDGGVGINAGLWVDGGLNVNSWLKVDGGGVINGDFVADGGVEITGTTYARAVRTSGNMIVDGGIEALAQVSVSQTTNTGGFPGSAFLATGDQSDGGTSIAFAASGRSINYLRGYASTSVMPDCATIIGYGGYTYAQDLGAMVLCNGTSWRAMAPLATATTAGGVMYGSSTSISASAAGTSPQVLHSGGSGAPTWSLVSLTTDVSGVLPIANGGTNGTATPVAGGVAYGTGSNYAFTANGTTGLCLKAVSGGTPVWGSCASATVSFGQSANYDVGSLAVQQCEDFTVTVSPATTSGAACSVGFNSGTIGGATSMQYTAWPVDSTTTTYVRACCNGVDDGGVSCNPGNQKYNVTCIGP